MLILNRLRLVTLQDEWSVDKVARKIWMTDLRAEEADSLEVISFNKIEHGTGNSGTRVQLSSETPEVLPQLVLGKKYYLALVPVEDVPNTERERVRDRVIDLRRESGSPLPVRDSPEDPF